MKSFSKKKHGPLSKRRGASVFVVEMGEGRSPRLGAAPGPFQSSPSYKTRIVTVLSGVTWASAPTRGPSRYQSGLWAFRRKIMRVSDTVIARRRASASNSCSPSSWASSHCWRNPA